MALLQACKESVFRFDDEVGYDYAEDDEFDLEDTSEPNHREWLLNIYNGIWHAQGSHQYRLTSVMSFLST